METSGAPKDVKTGYVLRTFNSTQNSLKSVFNVCRRKPSLGASKTF